MRIAEIARAAIVTSIIDTVASPEFDGSILLSIPPTPQSVGYFEAADEVEAGWLFNDGVFSPPPEPEPPTLEEAKTEKRKDLMAHRDAIVAEGFLYGGYLFPIDDSIQTTMLVQFTASQLMPAPSYIWKDKGGIYREIGDTAAFQMFVTMAMMYGQILFAREEMLQGLVETAQTVEEVQAVTWDTVPDEPV